MPKVKIIINADDFGLAHSTNKAIVKSFEQNLCTSTTILTNMPFFEEAVQLAHENNLVSKIGIHLNLTEGQPITEKIRYCKRLCNEKGYFEYKLKSPLFFLTAEEKVAIYEELSAQIVKCKNNNIAITHIDSHHHIHTDLSILRIVISLAKKFKIRSIRLKSNYPIHMSLKMKSYVLFHNFLLAFNKLKKTDYFGDIADFINIQNNNSIKISKIYEIMIHPDLDEKNNIIDRIHKKQLKFFQNELKNSFLLSHF